MRKIRSVKAFWIGLFLLLATMGTAQIRTQFEPTYRLQVDDVVSIQVYDQPQLSGSATVTRDGNIIAPFLGSVRAAGRTADELSSDLAELYKRKLRLREPLVSVMLNSIRQLRATVIGQVLSPGTRTFRQGDTILLLLAQGGGVNRDVADLRRAYLRRAGSQETIPIDLYAMTVYGDMSQNYELRDGDELTIPETQRNLIIIQGAIARPGQYPYREPMTLADIIALGGGEIPRRTRFSRTTVLRQRPGQPGEYIRIQADYVRFVRKGDGTQNILLQPGDFVYVPETNTPDFAYIGSLVNVAYIFDTFGNVFGLRLLGRR